MSTDFHQSLYSSSSDWYPVQSGINYRYESRSKALRCLTSCFRCCRLCCGSKLITVEPVVFLYMFATYLFAVIFELYSFNRYGRSALENSTTHPVDVAKNICLNTTFLDEYGHGNRTGDDVESSTAFLALLVSVVGQLPSIVASLILGPLSDKFGRRPTMIVILVGFCVHATLSIIIIYQELNLYFFMLSAGVRGATGGVAGILTVCYAYMADISSQKWLTVRLGLLEAAIFLAGTLSLSIGGVWVQWSNCDFTEPTWLVLCCVIAALPYVLIVLPQPVDQNEENNEMRNKRPKPKMYGGPKALLRGLQIFFCKGYPRWKLWFSLLTMAVATINTTGTVVVMTLFLLHKPLQWSPLLIGLYLAASELIHGLTLIIFLPLLVASGVPDSLIILTGLGLSCAMDVCLGFVVKTWQMFVVGAIQGVEALVTPASKAIMSKLVEPEDQGALFSFVSATQVLATAVSYVVYAVTYSQTLHMGWEAGTSFWLMAILYVVPVPFVIMLLVRNKQDVSSPPPLQRCSTPATPSPSTPPIPSNPFILRRHTPIEVSCNHHQEGNSEFGQEAFERQSLISSASYELQRSYHSVQ